MKMSENYFKRNEMLRGNRQKIKRKAKYARVILT